MSSAAPETRPGPRFVSPVEGARREDEERREMPTLYKSLLMTRLLIGIVGVALPTFILLWDLRLDLVANRPVRPLGSLSAYYYQPSPVSWSAGIAALIVSLFPTNDGGTPSTWVSNLHFVAAAVVILGLGALCVGSGRPVAQLRRADRRGDRRLRVRRLLVRQGLRTVRRLLEAAGRRPDPDLDA